MKWFYDLKIGRKIILGYLIIAMIAGGIGAMGLIGIQKISQQDVYLYEKMAKPLGNWFILSTPFRGIIGKVDDLAGPQRRKVLMPLKNFKETLVRLPILKRFKRP